MTVARENVASVMSSPVLTAYIDESLWEAWQLLFVSGLRHLAVLTPDGTCVGVLSDRTVLATGPAAQERLRSSRILDVLSRVPAVHVHPSTPVVAAAGLMVESQVEALTVIDDGRLVGIITESDVVRWLAGGLKDRT